MKAEHFALQGFKALVESYFDILRGDDVKGTPYVVEYENGWVVKLADGRRARMRLATPDDLARDPYDSIPVRFETDWESAPLGRLTRLVRRLLR